MVVRAVARIGIGDELEGEALAAMAALDTLTLDGEPIVSVYRDQQDGPWQLDVLFTETEEAARARWLAIATELRPELDFVLDPLAERDWVAESQKALHPVRAGRFLVHGSHDSERLAPSRWRLLIDAGRAFGTAHHASTKGCLLALTRVALRAGLGRVQDVGTGSGVLALAADRLGARSVAAGDVDPVAVEVARANITANRGRLRIRPKVAAGSLTRADTTVANILARPLMAMAPQLARDTGRTLILSGLRVRDGRRVAAAYRARGFVLHEAIVLEDWVTLTLARGGRKRRGRRAAVRRTGS